MVFVFDRIRLETNYNFSKNLLGIIFLGFPRGGGFLAWALFCAELCFQTLNQINDFVRQKNFWEWP